MIYFSVILTISVIGCCTFNPALLCWEPKEAVLRPAEAAEEKADGGTAATSCAPPALPLHHG